MSDIQKGSTVNITHKVLVDGKVAFSQGEQVVVEQVLSSPPDPGLLHRSFTIANSIPLDLTLSSLRTRIPLTGLPITFLFPLGSIKMVSCSAAPAEIYPMTTPTSALKAPIQHLPSRN